MNFIMCLESTQRLLIIMYTICTPWSGCQEKKIKAEEACATSCAHSGSKFHIAKGRSHMYNLLWTEVPSVAWKDDVAQFLGAGMCLVLYWRQWIVSFFVWASFPSRMINYLLNRRFLQAVGYVCKQNIPIPPPSPSLLPLPTSKETNKVDKMRKRPAKPEA